MKDINKNSNLLMLLLFTIVSFNCKAQITIVQDYSTDIIGTWVANDDSSYKLQFTNDGKQKEYINNQLQSVIYNYSISRICGNNSDNGYDFYLKTYTTSTDYVCDIINNISTDQHGVKTLSITSQRGKLELYTKQ